MERKLTPKEKYDKNNTTRLSLKLNLNTDKDILDYLEKTGSKQGTIKQALREKMARE
jgi:hypothetical protein